MKRLAIFAHYDAQGEVKPYIAFHLQALRACCEHLIFVSTASLPDAERNKVNVLCDSVFLRPNIGFDFGMWQFAMTQTELQDWDEIVLTNSSVFGPLWPLADAFQQMAHEPCDFWGMTDSYQHNWHIQSYFMVFRRPVIQSEVFSTFWKSVLLYSNKKQIILSYEVGLTQFLLQAGFVARAFVPTLSLLPKGISRYLIRRYRRYKYKNPAVAYFHELLRSRMPFVKRELFHKRPAFVRRALRGLDYDLLFLRSSKGNG